MDMAIVPVEIELDDLRAYTQVAFFIDSPSLLNDIAKIRKKFRIKAPLPRENYLDDGTFITVGTGVEDFINGKNQGDRKSVNLGKDFDSEITNTRKSYHYPEMFDDVLKQAVMFNKISKYKTAYATHYVTPQPAYRANVQEWSDSPQQEGYMAIVVTPYSSQEDIMEAFKQCCEYERLYVEDYSPVYQKLDTDTISNIERDRGWYWERMKGTSYKEIHNNWNNMCPNFKNSTPHDGKCQYCDLVDQNTIEKAVSRYKKHLKS